MMAASIGPVSVCDTFIQTGSCYFCNYSESSVAVLLPLLLSDFISLAADQP